MTRIVDAALGVLALEDAESVGTRYAPRGGLPPLRQAIAALEHVAAEDVVVTSGASMGLTSALAALPPGGVLIPRPYYPPYLHASRRLGRAVHHYNLDHPAGILAAIGEQLGAHPVAGVVLNTPGNPLGNIWNAADVRSVIAAATGVGAVVIIDETYKDLVFDPPDDPWHSEPAESGVVRLGSLSKRFRLAGHRVGYVVAESRLLADIDEAHWVFAMSTAVLSQIAALQALAKPPPVPPLVAVLRSRRDAALDLITPTAGCACARPMAGQFLWIELPGIPTSSPDLAERCLAAGVAVAPAEIFGSAACAVRASFALTESEVESAFTRLRQVFEAELAAVAGSDDSL